MKRQTHLPRTNRRTFIKHSSLATAAMVGALPTLLEQTATAVAQITGKRTPVILATDIGDDIDDTWALGFLLKCPELDLKLVLTDYGKPQYRAKLLARFLQDTGHTQVEVAVGPDAEPHGEGGQAAWVKDYDLKSYPGKVHTNGVQAVIDTIMHSKEQVTLIGIGPMPNVAATLAREPRITRHARFIGMDGSVRLGYARFVGGEGSFRPGNDGPTPPCAEWNVKAAPKAAQQVLSAPWDITITPLDTCGLVTLDGERYARLLKSQDPIVTAIIENYRIWSRGHPDPKEAERHSSVLFDTVAVYLAVSRQLCKMERLGIRVSDDGFTLIDDHAKKMNVATGWNTLDGYRDFLVNRLLSS
jgi:inosine-uridine nucleoside N-ribohydrolase